MDKEMDISERGESMNKRAEMVRLQHMRVQGNNKVEIVFQDEKCGGTTLLLFRYYR